VPQRAGGMGWILFSRMRLRRRCVSGSSSPLFGTRGSSRWWFDTWHTVLGAVEVLLAAGGLVEELAWTVLALS
jgi:hypothetical protein